MSKQQTGAALVEILIVILLGSMILGFVLHADLSVNRSIKRWMLRSSLEEATLYVTKQIRADISQSDSVILQDEREFSFLQSDSLIAHYLLEDQFIIRNGISLLPVHVTLDTFFLNAFKLESEHFLGETDSTRRGQFELNLVLRRGDEAIQTVTMPLRPYLTRIIE